VPTAQGRLRVRQVHGRSAPPSQNRNAAMVSLVPTVELDGTAAMGPGERLPDGRLPTGRAGSVRGRPSTGLLRIVQIRPKRSSAGYVVLRHRTGATVIGHDRGPDDHGRFSGLQ